VGSSANSSLGRTTKARASADALLLAAGKVLRVVKQALAEAYATEHLNGELLGLSILRKLERKHHVLERGERRQELERLETRTRRCGPRSSGALVLVPARRDPDPRCETAPAVGVSNPARIASSVDLPEPEAPTTASALARRDGEVDLAEESRGPSRRS
jgi:hypothetical protein